MNTLLKFFRDDRPKYKQAPNVRLEEVAVNVLKHQDADALKGVKDVLFLAVSTLTTVAELKQRLYGQTSIHASKIRLMLCGQVLSNLDFLPPEVFESSRKARDEDEDLFRPRIFMSILQAADSSLLEDTKDEDEGTVISELDMGDALADDVDEEEKDEVALAAEREESQMLAEKMAADEAEARVIEERNTKAQELEQQLLDMHKKKTKMFSLRKDLERIQCGHFFEALKEAGFDDEGCFAEIDHEQLLEKGLWIPRKARTRMVALANSLKTRIAASGRRKSVAKDKVNADMRASEKLHGHMIEGIDEVLTNKKDINAAYDKKMKMKAEVQREANLVKQLIADERARRANPEPKMHPPQLQQKIDRIRWANLRDEYDVPVNVYKAEAPTFCCNKHKREVLERRDTFVRGKSDSNRSDLGMQVKLADRDNLGFVSRDILRVIFNEHFKKLGFGDQLDPAELEGVLNDAIIDSADQTEMFQWTAREKYRQQNPNGFIPVAIYDANYIIEVLVLKLEQLEYDRYVSQRLDKPTYVVIGFEPVKHDFSGRKNHSTPHERALKKQAFR